MRFSATVTTVLLATLSGTTLAAQLSAHQGRSPAEPAALEKRDCNCDCRSDCHGNCSEFGGTAGSQIAYGMCLLSCADSCGCDPNVPCREVMEDTVFCETVVKTLLGGSPFFGSAVRWLREKCGY